MATAKLNSTTVTKVYKGLSSDLGPDRQPKECPRFALNAVNEASDGEQLSLSNERGFLASTNFPAGFYPIGDRYLEDNQTVVILVNPTTGRSEIGTVTKDDKYTTIVNTGGLNLKITHQCDIIYRLRRGTERVIYWVDGYNRPRTFNLDRLYNFYTNAYTAYLNGGGDPNTYVGEKWDNSSFDLIKSYQSIPFFTNVEITQVGSILPGSYNFAIQLVDADLNPTEWITTSNTVNMYNDSTDSSYDKIRGSRNTQDGLQSFDRINKSIKLTLTNLDTNFPYYRIAIIPATSVDGNPTRAFVSDIQAITQNTFVYSGNDSSLTQTSLEDILIENEVIYSPNHIEQIENRLVLADTKGQSVNWCDYQKFASKISSDLVTKDIILNSVLSEPNLKNAKSTFMFRGYMPGEVYSFAIVYVFKDGSLSPAFHIPGKGINDLSSTMKGYELTSIYEDIHNCSISSYWGKDSKGDTLLGRKVRHHRFPFRSDVGLPLYTRDGSTTVINKYRLIVTISLNPDYDTGETDPDTGLPVPNYYPLNPDGTTKVIPYYIQYKVGSASNTTITKQLTNVDTNTAITIYDDTGELSSVAGTSSTVPIEDITQGVVSIVAGSLSDYLTGANPRFLISGEYGEYNAASVYNTDTSKIMGIKFGNIEKPSDDVVGFYIVRNERNEDDKIVVDNAIFGPMIENNQYKAFGLWNPKQYYSAPTVNGNCSVNGSANSGKTLTYYKRGVWFWNPEFQFFTKKGAFTDINIQAQYTETSVTLPSRKAEYNGCTDYRGLYLEDVQAGTSFNPDVNKGSDSDGFDLLAGYRNTEMGIRTTTATLPQPERVFYLNAAAYQSQDSNVLYNVSCDNKMGIGYFDVDIDTEMFYNTSTKKNSLLYAALTRENNTAYSNFMSRSYYKEHNNPFLFEDNTVINNIEVFNGDAYISPVTLVSSIFYDIVVAVRKKKSSIWKIVVGAILVVGAIAATIFTAGAASASVVVAVGALSSVALSLGMSMAMAGIKFEQFKSMYEVDYSKGLKDCVTDGAVFECIREGVATADDTIRWFVDRVSNIYIESSVPVALRDGITSGVVDFINAPAQFDEDGFRSYITEKLTTIDRDQGSGRLYKGYASAEFYSVNPDYMRFNKQKLYIHLPVEYDCCSDDEENYFNRIWWSEQSFQEEKTDNYRVFLPNNYVDIEGEHGRITDLYRLGNALFVHCKEVLFQLPQNLQERVTSEVVSFIGTGEFFNIPPRKVVDDNLGSAGTQHKWASVKTKMGFLFVNEIENKVYLNGESVKDISAQGLRNWFESNLKSFLSQQFYENLGIPYPNDNNPANPGGIGYTAAYDTRHERYILTKRDFLFLGDFSKIILDFNPADNYLPGEILIGDTGFEEIIDSRFEPPVAVDFSGWIEDTISDITPTLLVPTSPSNKLRLNYGYVYQDGPDLIYQADSYEDINFNGGTQVNDTIQVNLGACTPSTVDVIIPNIPSKRCPNFFSSGGQVAYQETKIVLGNKAGKVKFLLSTYTIPDSFKIYYGEPVDNVLIWSTCELPGSAPDCLVSTASIEGNPEYAVCPSDPKDSGDNYEVAIIFDYQPTDEDIQHVTLVTQAPLSGTAWSYNMGCPCNDGLPVDPEDMSTWDYCQDCSS